ncbi:MAG: serine/threonine protein kinase [Myxococcaceae bacterium]
MPAGMPVCPRDGAPAEDPDAAPEDRMIGQMIGEYRLKGLIGEGGMGQVYEGLQPVIGKRVAIKLLRREIATNPEEAQRLLGEARAVNSIGHRGIIDIFSFGALPDGRQYFVMEYLSGMSLAQHLHTHGVLPVEDTLRLLDETLAALGAAHAAGVIHRDLKPSNIFLVAQPDGSSYVKLLDFGISKQAPTARGETPQTSISRVLGTPGFMAPEQARGQPIGPRTDLYALGVIAFEMFTGELLFDADTVFEIVNLHLNKPAPAPSSRNPGLPPEIDALVLHLLKKKPVERPESAEAVRGEIKRIRRTLNLNATRLALAPTSGTQVVSMPAPQSHERSRETGDAAASQSQEITAAGSENRIVDRSELRRLDTTAPTAAPAKKRKVLPTIALLASLAIIVAAVAKWAFSTPAPVTDPSPEPVVAQTTEVPTRPAAPPPDPDPDPDRPTAALNEPRHPKPPERLPDPKPRPAKPDPLAARFKRVQAAWAKTRASRSAEDRRIFDMMLNEVGRQLAGGARSDATEGLTDFVNGALNGREP